MEFLTKDPAIRKHHTNTVLNKKDHQVDVDGHHASIHVRVRLQDEIQHPKVWARAGWFVENLLAIEGVSTGGISDRYEAFIWKGHAFCWSEIMPKIEDLLIRLGKELPVEKAARLMKEARGICLHAKGIGYPCNCGQLYKIEVLTTQYGWEKS